MRRGAFGVKSNMQIHVIIREQLKVPTACRHFFHLNKLTSQKASGKRFLHSAFLLSLSSQSTLYNMHYSHKHF